MKIKEDDIIFLDALQKRIPDRKVLINTLIDILEIEKEAVYRRLRKEVAFSFTEICKISRALSISLDNVVGMGVDYSIVRPCRVVFQDFLNPTTADYESLENFMSLLGQLKDSDNSESYYAAHTLPQPLLVRYENLYKFYLFKWKFQQEGSYGKVRFKDINPPGRLKEINYQYMMHHIETKVSHVILDRFLFQNLVDKINYFTLFHLIDREEVELIKEELLDLINWLNVKAMQGTYINGNEMNLYISHVNLYSSQHCLQINEQEKISLGCWRVFMDIVSVDHLTYDNMKKWFFSLIRTSTLVSQTAEVERIKYFNEQVKIVNKL